MQCSRLNYLIHVITSTIRHVNFINNQCVGTNCCVFNYTNCIERNVTSSITLETSTSSLDTILTCYSPKDTDNHNVHIPYI